MKLDSKQKTRGILSIYLVLSLIADLIVGVDVMVILYALVALVLLNLFDLFFKKVLRCNLPFWIFLLDALFITEACYIGNRLDLYNRFFGYDILLHFASGIIIALSLYEALLAPFSDKTPLAWRLFMTFVIALAAAGFWEILEFSMDALVKTDFQRNFSREWEIFGSEGQNPGILDTMNDIINGTVGGLVGATLIYLRNKREKGLSSS